VDQEAKKPKGERRPVPQAPKILEEVKVGGAGKGQTESMEEYNKQAFNDYNDKALEKCVGCGRTFLPD